MAELPSYDRRALLARLVILAGASTVALDGTAMAESATDPGPPLDQATFALLSAVADTIIPATDTAGAVEAKVPAGFAALLADWASASRRHELIDALHEIDSSASSEAGTPFAQLPPDQRTAFLAEYDARALSPVSGSSPPVPANPAYALLKDLLVTLFYLSQAALTTELEYVHAPGPWQPSIPVTSTTRQVGGGLF